MFADIFKKLLFKGVCSSTMLFYTITKSSMSSSI